MDSVVTSTSNGVASVSTSLNGHTPDGATDWRHEALFEAIRCGSRDGSPYYVILGAFQQHLPHMATHFFRENRPRTMAALKRFLPEFTTLIAPAQYTDEEEPSVAIYGWWRGVTAEGAVYEIAQAPDCYGEGDFIIGGPSDAEVEKFVRAVLDDATRNTCRCLRYTNGSWRDALEMQTEVEATDWSDIVLTPSLMDDIRANIDSFFSQKELFHRLGFAWRRGILLVGPPGTGKTMVCKAAAKSHAEVPFLYVRDLTSHRAQDALSSVFQRARRLAPCILAIEDMDGLIHKDNRTMFLNELDGFKNNDGLLIIASSNHPERIDEALLKRPSRFDRVYHIGLPEKAERTEYTRRLLAKCPMPISGLDFEELAGRVADATEGFTPAFLKEAFLSATLAAAQSGKSELGADFGDAVMEQVDLLKKYLKKARNPESFAEMLPSTGAEIGFRAR